MMKPVFVYLFLLLTIVTLRSKAQDYSLADSFSDVKQYKEYGDNYEWNRFLNSYKEDGIQGRNRGNKVERKNKKLRSLEQKKMMRKRKLKNKLKRKLKNKFKKKLKDEKKKRQRDKKKKKHHKKKKEGRKGRKDFGRAGNKKQKISPSFKLARTRLGFVVKQAEKNPNKNGIGGFSYPKKPIFMRSIEYNFDGSVSPVIRLSETKKGLVGKTLENSVAKQPGADWSGRRGSVKTFKGGRTGGNSEIMPNGRVTDDMKQHSLFPNGAITKRGTLKFVSNFTSNMSANFEAFPPIKNKKESIKDLEKEKWNKDDDFGSGGYDGGGYNGDGYDSGDGYDVIYETDDYNSYDYDNNYDSTSKYQIIENDGIDWTNDGIDWTNDDIEWTNDDYGNEYGGQYDYDV